MTIGKYFKMLTRKGPKSDYKFFITWTNYKYYFVFAVWIYY